MLCPEAGIDIVSWSCMANDSELSCSHEHRVFTNLVGIGAKRLPISSIHMGNKSSSVIEMLEDETTRMVPDAAIAKDDEASHIDNALIDDLDVYEEPSSINMLSMFSTRSS